MPLTLDTLRSRLPARPLFAEKEFLLSPEPLRLDPATVSELEKLGHRLLLFQRASNELYHRSHAGKAPGWVAAYLDAGKPADLLAFARNQQFRAALPQVIRPDLLLTQSGFAITELDSVPGGIGLTAWLSETYATAGHDVIGGAGGMLAGFRSILGERADILVSDESAVYRPEMEWCADRVNAASGGSPGWRVLRAEDYGAGGFSPAPVAYRFFELFDLPAIPGARTLMEHAAAGRVRITPPIKPWLEEKLWLALFWSRPLREFWRRELSERHFTRLQPHIPMSWVLDPAPVPHHAVIPGLEISDWSELAEFSQKQRDLVIKISGFSPQAWGSRGVVVGSDVPGKEWAEAVRQALAGFDRGPSVLMRFAHTRVVEHPYFDPATGDVRTMRGRVRLCPYYFVADEKAVLGGVLATIVPADKKVVHGMRDAILVPASAGP